MKKLLFQKKPIKAKHKRRTYLLLEVLIAFALLALCLFPIIKPMMGMVHKQRQYLESMQLHRLSQLYFADLKQQFYEKSPHSFKQLSKGCEGRLTKVRSIDFGDGKICDYECSYRIAAKETLHKKSQGKKYLLLDIELALKPVSSYRKEICYDFALLVENTPIKKAS